jgi:hypothetical protein
VPSFGLSTFDDFCNHWKSNHRVFVQRRLLAQQRREARDDSSGDDSGDDHKVSESAALHLLKQVYPQRWGHRKVVGVWSAAL